MKKIFSEENLEKTGISITKWIGSPLSLLIHTLLFTISFLLYFFGIPLVNILLVLTTIVSLEAIYLSIFIQMSVNIQLKKIQSVAIDVGDIQEDVEEIQKDVEEIQEDVDDEEDEEDETLLRIEKIMVKLTKEVIELKKQSKQQKIN